MLELEMLKKKFGKILMLDFNRDVGYMLSIYVFVFYDFYKDFLFK